MWRQKVCFWCGRFVSSLGVIPGTVLPRCSDCAATLLLRLGVRELKHVIEADAGYTEAVNQILQNASLRVVVPPSPDIHFNPQERRTKDDEAE